MARKKKTVWLVGGGTGGHIVPLLAVAEELKKDPSISLLYIGDKDGKEVNLAQRYGLRFASVPSGKLRRYLSVSSFFLNIRDLVRLKIGILKSIWMIRKTRPDLILSKGGQVALPVCIAASLLRIPILTHESDAVIGKANGFIAEMAKYVLTAFPPTSYPARYARKIKYVGLPLRSEFCRKHEIRSTRRPMVLVMGGSQGSVAINELLLQFLEDILVHASVVHITGDLLYERIKSIRDNLPEELQEHYVVLPFTPDIVDYMREASVVVVRSSSTIFELAALHKPMILIPLPTAANNHQVRNAEIFSEHNAAIMLIQDNLTPNRLYETINSVLNDAKLRRGLIEGTQSFQSCGAAKQVAAIVHQCLEDSHS